MRWQKQGYSYTEASAAMPMRLWMLSSKENLNSIRMSNAIITAMVKDIHAAVTKRAEPVIRAAVIIVVIDRTWADRTHCWRDGNIMAIRGKETDFTTLCLLFFDILW